MKYSKIDLQNWKRREQYDFFRTFDQPFFNITANIDVTTLYNYTKTHQLSFFYSSLHSVLKTTNAIPEFRYRIDGEAVIEYDEIHAGATIIKEDNTFVYCTIPYKSDLYQFVQEAKISVEEQKKTRGFLPHDRADVIYVSIIPWVAFTSFQHAQKTDPSDSVPRVVLGKYFKENEQLKMPVSVEVHHALADGYHVGLFFEKLQQIVNQIFES